MESRHIVVVGAGVGGLTSAARVLDPRYPSNLAIGLITIAVGALTMLLGYLSGGGLAQSLLQGILNAGAVFAAWAISRELDPDHDLSAFVGAGLTILLVFAVDGPIQLLPLVWLVLAIRSINRTTGFGPTLLDLTAILILGTWLGFSGSWAYLAATVLALVIVGISPEQRRRSIAFAAIGTGLAIVAFLTESAVLQVDRALFALGISALLVPVLLSSSAPTSTADLTGKPLDGRLVQAGQAFAISAGSLVALGGGLYDLLSLWAAVLGVSLYWTITTIRHHLLRRVDSK